MIDTTRRLLVTLAACCGCIAAVDAAAPAIPAPRDVDYPGAVLLHVDATDIEHRVFRVRQTLPVAGPGPLTLLYPRWLPGNHSTTGPIEMLAGLQVRTADGSRLDWQRDPERTYAFHLVVPDAVHQLELQFEFVTPVDADQGRVVMTPDLLGLQWEKALLYPAGHYSSRIRYEPSVTLPAGWEYATALEGARRQGDTVQFAGASLEHLVDSPLFAGPHARRIELNADAGVPVRLHVFADRPGELAATPEQVEFHRRMVREAESLFGARHYRHYDFLLAISDHFSGIGLEHHQSSENGVRPGYFTDWAGSTATSRDLLPHEMVHSWNGKFRRPADLWTPSYEIPMGSSLLWVYEGMTEYYGIVLAARSGLWTPQFTGAMLAQFAAAYDVGRAGRTWRSLQDTTQQPAILYRGLQSYPSWQRGKDYYTEGALLWLDVDTRIRELTRGRRSLDDFARRFFGVADGRIEPQTYTFEDVVATLDAVAPFDWARLLRERLDGHGPGAPLEGLARSGWRIVYAEEPTDVARTVDTANESDNFLFSLGFAVGKAGKLKEVYWDSPAFRAGLAPGMSVIAVNGRAYSAPLLREAIKDAQADPARKTELILRNADTYRTVSLDYHGGLRYPRLERIDGTEDRLAAILKPRTSPARPVKSTGAGR
jgi:predicted metalloprotease with PDZ domain